MKKKRSVQKKKTGQNKRMLIEEERRCSECGSIEIRTDEEEVYCSKCGYVFE